jgi:hypothetical protein
MRDRHIFAVPSILMGPVTIVGITVEILIDRYIPITSSQGACATGRKLLKKLNTVMVF